MKKLADEELSENDITIYIPFDADIPDEVKNELRYFGGVEVMNKKTGKMYTKYTVPAYRAREWEQLAEQYNRRTHATQ